MVWKVTLILDKKWVQTTYMAQTGTVAGYIHAVMESRFDEHPDRPLKLEVERLTVSPFEAMEDFEMGRNAP